MVIADGPLAPGAYPDARLCSGPPALRGNAPGQERPGQERPGQDRPGQSQMSMQASGPGAPVYAGALTDRIDPAIGISMAAPLIAKFRTGMQDGVAQYRHFAVLASGLNNDVDEGKARFAGSSAGALFLLALDKPAAVPWALGSNYYRLALPSLHGDATSANGLGPPVLAVGADGAVRHAYAGDLQGNLWRFDFTGKAAWPGAVPGQPLFVARDGAGARQPITQQPKLVFAPGGGYLVLFGTGKWLEAADTDPASFRTQSMYAIHDTPDAAAAAAPVAGRSALAARTLSGGSDAGFAISGKDLVLAGPGAQQGWYFDFPQAASTGERSVSSPVLAGGKLFFNTLLPGSDPGSDPCSAPAVRSYRVDSVSGLAIDALGMAHSGALTGQLSTDEVRGAPVVQETALSVGMPNGRGAATAQRQYRVFNIGKTGASEVFDSAGAAVSLPLPARRISWREIANWRELHEAAKK